MRNKSHFLTRSFKFCAWSRIVSNFLKGRGGDHNYKIIDRPLSPNKVLMSQVFLQLVVVTPHLYNIFNNISKHINIIFLYPIRYT